MKPYPNTIFLYLFCALMMSCTQKEQIDTSEFILIDNHSIELVAAEPDVILPVAMIEDSRNRFWVIEMPGYMRDIDGSDEELPDGRIVILTDIDNDGQVDKRKIFLDNLENPRAICFVNGGVLYTDGTMLKWTETKNDKPNNTIVVDSFYVIGGNIEHQPNGLLYNIDNWIYSAKSNARYQFSNGTWKKEATSFRGQWGITADHFGKLVYNHNSAPLLGDRSIPNQVLDNPFLDINNCVGFNLTDDMRIYPLKATSVNRGYLPDVLDDQGKVINYTSACAPHLFYGSQLSLLFRHAAFVCAPEANLISAYSYHDNTVQSKRKFKNREFLESNLESFRPVNLMTGFDGCLYVVDMRKGIIQHSAYMSSYLREAIEAKGLEKINSKGRIYRIKSNSAQTNNIKTDDLSSSELIKLLNHPNLQLRIFAQKQLIEKNDPLDIPLLFQLTLDKKNLHGQIHSIWTLQGMGKLSINHMEEIIETTRNPEVLIQLLAINRSSNNDAFLLKLYNKCMENQFKTLHFVLASLVGKSEAYEQHWFKIAEIYGGNDTLVSEALVSSIASREAYFLSKLKKENNEFLISLIKKTIENKRKNDIKTPVLINKPFDDDRTNGLKKYRTYCVSCHGLDGKGQKNVAPSLIESAIVKGEDAKIASIILHGYNSDKSVYKIMMPAYKDDKNMSDQDIVDIISYLKSTFTSDWNSLKKDQIKALR